MGLLDDAIREHLELKRRHGAADEEIKRLEQEALGPVRRRGEPLPPPEEDEYLEGEEAELADRAYDEGELDDDAYADIGVEDDQAVMPEPIGHEPALEPFPPDQEPAALPVTDPEPGAVPVREPRPQQKVDEQPSDEDDLWLDDSAEDAPPDDVLEPRGQQTAAFSAADVAEATGEPAPGEDELEETPDFLQETPEHDRLWFEQRPPRRFDFDE